MMVPGVILLVCAAACLAARSRCGRELFDRLAGCRQFAGRFHPGFESQFSIRKPRSALNWNAIVKAATEVKDNGRIVLYGERVLSREPGNRDLLDRVTRLLLTGEDKEKSGRALAYARLLEQSIHTVKGPAPGGSGAAGFAENRDRALGRSWLYQSRAIGNLGKLAEAEALARRGYEVYPTAESAREIGRWLHRQGKVEEAIARTSDAFAIADPAGEEADRKKDRTRLSEWYAQAKGSEPGSVIHPGRL